MSHVLFMVYFEYLENNIFSSIHKFYGGKESDYFSSRKIKEKAISSKKNNFKKASRLFFV